MLFYWDAIVNSIDIEIPHNIYKQVYEEFEEEEWEEEEVEEDEEEYIYDEAQSWIDEYMSVEYAQAGGQSSSQDTSIQSEALEELELIKDKLGSEIIDKMFDKKRKDFDDYLLTL